MRFDGGVLRYMLLLLECQSRGAMSTRGVELTCCYAQREREREKHAGYHSQFKDRDGVTPEPSQERT